VEGTVSGSRRKGVGLLQRFSSDEPINGGHFGQQKNSEKKISHRRRETFGLRKTRPKNKARKREKKVAGGRNKTGSTVKEAEVNWKGVVRKRSVEDGSVQEERSWPTVRVVGEVKGHGHQNGGRKQSAPGW